LLNKWRLGYAVTVTKWKIPNYLEIFHLFFQKYKLASLSPVQALSIQSQWAIVTSDDLSEQLLKTFIFFWIWSAFFPKKSAWVPFLRWFWELIELQNTAAVKKEYFRLPWKVWYYIGFLLQNLYPTKQSSLWISKQKSDK